MSLFADMVTLGSYAMGVDAALTAAGVENLAPWPLDFGDGRTFLVRPALVNGQWSTSLSLMPEAAPRAHGVEGQLRAWLPGVAWGEDEDEAEGGRAWAGRSSTARWHACVDDREPGVLLTCYADGVELSGSGADVEAALRGLLGQVRRLEVHVDVGRCTPMEKRASAADGDHTGIPTIDYASDPHAALAAALGEEKGEAHHRAAILASIAGARNGWAPALSAGALRWALGALDEARRHAARGQEHLQGVLNDVAVRLGLDPAANPDIETAVCQLVGERDRLRARISSPPSRPAPLDEAAFSTPWVGEREGRRHLAELAEACSRAADGRMPPVSCEAVAWAIEHLVDLQQRCDELEQHALEQIDEERTGQRPGGGRPSVGD